LFKIISTSPELKVEFHGTPCPQSFILFHNSDLGTIGTFVILYHPAMCFSCLAPQWALTLLLTHEQTQQNSVSVLQ